MRGKGVVESLREVGAVYGGEGRYEITIGRHQHRVVLCLVLQGLIILILVLILLAKHVSSRIWIAMLQISFRSTIPVRKKIRGNQNVGNSRSTYGLQGTQD